MKSLYKHYIFLVSIIAMLSSCSNDNTQTGSNEGAGKIKFSAAINDNIVEDSTVISPQDTASTTKSVKLSDGSTMEVTLSDVTKSKQKTSSVMGNGIMYRVFVYSSSNVFIKSGVFTHGSTTDELAVDAGYNYIIRAVSYNSTSVAPPETALSLTTPATLTVSPDYDVLYAETTYSNLPVGNTFLTLNFKHAFSQVTVVADAQTNRSQTITACAAKFSPGKNAVLSLNDGSVTDGGSNVTQNITWSTVGTGIVTSNSKIVYQGSTNTNTLTFTSITVGGTTYTNTGVSFTKTLLAGHAYLFKVIFSKDDYIVVGGYKWAKANLYEVTSGVYNIYTNQYDTKTSNSEAYWNWGAVHPKSDITSYYNSSTGTVNVDWVDWQITPPSATTDPCRKALGGTWRIPTNAELKNVSGAGYVWGAYGGGISTVGMWFGTSNLATAQANPTKYMFLPAKGFRPNGGTSAIQDGLSGWYWGSTRPSSGTQAEAFTIRPDNGGLVEYGSSNAQSKGLGFNLRCIKD